ncbi:MULTISPECIES: hypothetical protein [Pontibacillus]|uniref:Uncharacterized protein n=1 Tax=Pontibacillus chungwhensis TaxID=265426 RepID=A0ABY8UZY0_9BACI|nr:MULTISPECIES: hypothetical protein [Pontibacillus]MCD5324624.1 hypothetical protein [Pontibacillus sp. HN14]WIF99082.1 hypothetical protein QNI29_05350 [Pontibacillus chungwhensis]
MEEALKLVPSIILLNSLMNIRRTQYMINIFMNNGITSMERFSQLVGQKISSLFCGISLVDR